MIFIGDIALPHKGAINFSQFPTEFYNKKWFGNLEGAIVEKDDNTIQGVYNQSEAISELVYHFDYKGLGLANNHIFDTGTMDKTITFIEGKNIKYAGVGRDLLQANKEIILEEDGEQVIIINFGWEAIQCEITNGNYQGVNPLEKEHVLQAVDDLLHKYPVGKVIPFMHWSYELENTPQPFERELAKKLIDLGAFCVLGCHPHRVGGIEFYKGKPIVYSLGNWLFKQNHYFQNKLSFPSFCNLELAMEIDFSRKRFLFHFFEMNQKEAILKFQETITDDNSLFFKKLTPFSGLDNKSYETWYRKNHYHRKKGLPVFYWNDKHWQTSAKIEWIKKRDWLLKAILNKGK